MPQERTPVPFPIGPWSVLFAAVAGYGIYSTARDALLFSQPAVVHSAADLVSLQDGALAQAHLPIDLDEAKTFSSSESEREFTVFPLEGTENQLFYSEEKSDADGPSIDIPLRGRVGARGSDGKWAVGDGVDVDLNELYQTVPDDAFVIREMIFSRAAPWQWLTTGVAVLYLLYLAYRLAVWSVGSWRSHESGNAKTHSADVNASP